jgi:hypothetical protein
LTSLIPARRLNRLARELRVVVRNRKVKALALFWTLVLGFGAGSERTLAGLRRYFEQASGVTLVPSAFYLRFTPALAGFLKAVLMEALQRVSQRSGALKGPLGAFRDVVSIDATVIRLHDLLAKAFPACRTNHTRAAVNLHAVMSVKGAGPRSVKLTSERVHEGPVLRAGRWVAGLLLLFDLGYSRYQLFDYIDRCRGYFITRLKDRANPTITVVHRRWRGARCPWWAGGSRTCWGASSARCWTWRWSWPSGAGPTTASAPPVAPASGWWACAIPRARATTCTSPTCRPSGSAPRTSPPPTQRAGRSSIRDSLSGRLQPRRAASRATCVVVELGA